VNVFTKSFCESKPRRGALGPALEHNPNIGRTVG
jgi:hypothetical protein